MIIIIETDGDLADTEQEITVEIYTRLQVEKQSSRKV